MTFEAILFDCDGVLVDSEPTTNGLLRDMLDESGRPLTEDWMRVFYERRNAVLAALLQAGASQLFGCMADLPKLLAVA